MFVLWGVWPFLFYGYLFPSRIHHLLTFSPHNEEKNVPIIHLHALITSTMTILYIIIIMHHIFVSHTVFSLRYLNISSLIGDWVIDFQI